MDESKVLSTEEVDALSKASQEGGGDLTTLINQKSSEEDLEKLNNKALANIIELTWSEIEKVFSSFLRKKIVVKPKASSFGQLGTALENKKEKHVYSVQHIMSKSYFCLTIISLPLLHQAINLLYGGVTNANDTIIESPGKIGILLAEKISELIMEGFTIACKEYGNINYEVVKTVTLPNLISKLTMEDEVYSMEYTLVYGEIETDLTIIVPIEFLQKFVPVNIIDENHHAKTNRIWRKAIEHQVIDSTVTLIASLPDISMNVKDLVNLKEGDLIPIGDPTIVNVFLNGTKLFGATAAQSNSNRVIKISEEI